MMIHRLDPLRNEPWYLFENAIPSRQHGDRAQAQILWGGRRTYFVTHGESSWERIWISCWMSSISSSAFSRSITLIATRFPVRRSTLW